MNFIRSSLLCFLIGAAASGCAVYARPLSSLQLSSTSHLGAGAPPLAHTDKRILIAPFEDLRGPEYARFSAGRFIPGVHLFHYSEQFHYPEQAALLHTREHHHTVITTGALGAAMPTLLVDMMRRMQASTTTRNPPTPCSSAASNTPCPRSSETSRPSSPRARAP